jgi:hypothetical protein
VQIKKHIIAQREADMVEAKALLETEHKAKQMHAHQQ